MSRVPVVSLKVQRGRGAVREHNDWVPTLLVFINPSFRSHDRRPTRELCRRLDVDFKYRMRAQNVGPDFHNHYLYRSPEEAVLEDAVLSLATSSFTPPPTPTRKHIRTRPHTQYSNSSRTHLCVLSLPLPPLSMSNTRASAHTDTHMFILLHMQAGAHGSIHTSIHTWAPCAHAQCRPPPMWKQSLGRRLSIKYKGIAKTR